MNVNAISMNVSMNLIRGSLGREVNYMIVFLALCITNQLFTFFWYLPQRLVHSRTLFRIVRLRGVT